MFVDATYGIVPHPFYQCLIIMVFDMARHTYIPCAWVLMTGKTSECYWQVFNWLTAACPDLDPSYIGVDFERAFFSNVSAHFPRAKLIGCLFHFKQAGRRKMKNLGFPDKEVAFAMRRGIYDLLTIIPVEHLTVGVEFVMEMIFVHLRELYDDDDSMYEKAVSRWTHFWSTYF
jgi:hypothetical protein